MNPSLNVLIVGADPTLSREIGAALKALPEGRTVIVHTADNYRQGIEAARSRRPDLLLVEMTNDLRALTSFAEEVTVASPDSISAAVFHPQIFGADVSESAVIIEALRSGLRDFLRRPVSSNDLEQLLSRLQRRARPSTSRLGKTIALVSNKGGVGKSTLAVNLAAGLARSHPRRVLLIDAALQMGVCATLLDLQPQTNLLDAVRQRQRLDETLLRQLATQHATGLDLLAAPRDAIEASEVDDEAMARVLTLSRREYDFVIVDSFPLLDRVMMAVLDLSDLIFMVLESVVPTVLGAAKLLQLLDTLGIPHHKQRLILNRYSRFAGNLSPADVSAKLGRKIDYIIPYQKKLLIAGNIGQPYITQVGRFFNAWGRSMRGVIADLESFQPPRVSVEANGQSAAPLDLEPTTNTTGEVPHDSA